jgi:hypothetical protein
MATAPFIPDRKPIEQHFPYENTHQPNYLDGFFLALRRAVASKRHQCEY